MLILASKLTEIMDLRYGFGEGVYGNRASSVEMRILWGTLKGKWIFGNTSKERYSRGLCCSLGVVVVGWIELNGWVRRSRSGMRARWEFDCCSLGVVVVGWIELNG